MYLGKIVEIGGQARALRAAAPSVHAGPALGDPGRRARRSGAGRIAAAGRRAEPAARRRPAAASAPAARTRSRAAPPRSRALEDGVACHFWKRDSEPPLAQAGSMPVNERLARLQAAFQPRRRTSMKKAVFGIALVRVSSAAQAQTLRIGLAEDPDILDPTLARTFVGRIVFAAPVRQAVRPRREAEHRAAARDLVRLVGRQQGADARSCARASPSTTARSSTPPR